MRNTQIAGIAATLVLMASCFMPWAWYPDLQQHFTGFYSEGNYYGRPGKMLYFFAISSLVFFAFNKVWMQRINLIFGALCLAYSVYAFILFTGGYDGFVPTAKPGIYLMLLSAIVIMVMAVLNQAMVKKQVPTTTAAPTEAAPVE